MGGVSATYDANGNSLNDTFRTFTWDADGNPVTIGPVSLTYDALDRMVEQSVSSTNSEIVYSPTGVKLALMNGATLTKAFVPLTGGATAVYNSSGLAYYRHTDHLGSSRFASTPTQTLYSDTAYSAFGEPYASSGAIDNSFTGQNQDTTAGLYDFLFREQDPNQTRWTQSDPAGIAAVNPTDPQSWNRYSYVRNMPLMLIDPLGTCPGGIAQNRDNNRSQDSKSSGPSNPESDYADPQGIGSSVPPGPCPGFTDQGGGGGILGSDPFFDDGNNPFAPSFPLGGGGGGSSLDDFGINNFAFPGIGVMGADPWIAFTTFDLMPLCFPFLDDGTGNVIYAGTCGSGNRIDPRLPTMGPHKPPKSIIGPNRPPSPPTPQNVTGGCMAAALMQNFVGNQLDELYLTAAVHVAAYVAVKRLAPALLPGPGWAYVVLAGLWDAAAITKSYVGCKYNGASSPQ